MEKRKTWVVRWTRAAAGLLGVLLVMAGAFPAFGQEKDPLVYAKNGWIYWYDSEAGIGKKLIHPISGPGEMLAEDDYETLDVAMLDTTGSTSDGRFLVYLDVEQGKEDSYFLKCMDLSLPGDQQEASMRVLADGVGGMQLTPENRVMYVTDDGFYIYDLNRLDQPETANIQIFTMDQVSKKIKDIVINEACTQAVLVADRGEGQAGFGIYLADLNVPGGDFKELAVTDRASAEISADLQTIYYSQDDVVYCLKNLSENKTIGADIEEIFAVGGQGLYYGKNGGEIKLSDFVEIVDDMAEADAAIHEPFEEDYMIPETGEDGTVTYRFDTTAYSMALDAYSDKHMRDQIRELSESSISQCYDLYYYDGKGSQEIAKRVFLLEPLGTDRDVFLYARNTSGKKEVWKLSETAGNGGYAALFYKLYNLFQGDNAAYYLLDESSSHKMTEDILQASDFSVDENNKTFYFISDLADGGSGELKAIYYDGSEAQTQVIDTGVLGFLEGTGDRIFYIKYSESGGASLYENGIKIADDVINYFWENGTLYYCKFGTADKDAMDLYRYNNKVEERIADNVWMFSILDDNRIALLMEVTDKGTGTLYLWEPGQELKRVDEEVRYIKDALY